MIRKKEGGSDKEDQVSSTIFYMYMTLLLRRLDFKIPLLHNKTNGSRCMYASFLLPSAKFWVPDPDIRDALMRCCVSQSYKAFLWHLFPEEVKSAINSVSGDTTGMDRDGSTRSLQARKEAAVASLRLDNAKINKASTLPQYRALKPMIYGFLRCVIISVHISSSSTTTIFTTTLVVACLLRVSYCNCSILRYKLCFSSATKPTAYVFLSPFRALLRLAGDVADRKLLCFIFQSIEHYVLFFVLFPGVAKAWLKFFLKSWSDPGNADIEEGATLQVLSFFRIRDMALRLPPPFLEECLRGAYLTCARVAKFVSEQTRPALTFMGNGIVELYNIDVAVAYQNAFTYVRQLALVLRQVCVCVETSLLKARQHSSFNTLLLSSSSSMFIIIFSTSHCYCANRHLSRETQAAWQNFFNGNIFSAYVYG